MEKEDCIFCRIGSHQAEATIEYEDKDWIVFHDVRPSAPVHLLIVPKKHFCWWDDLKEYQDLLGQMVGVAVIAAEKAGIRQSGFKLVMNGGKSAGQVIDHFHVHLLGGWSAGGG